MSITTEKLEELNKNAHKVLKNKVSMDIDAFYYFIDLLIDESKKNDKVTCRDCKYCDFDDDGSLLCTYVGYQIFETGPLCDMFKKKGD